MRFITTPIALILCFILIVIVFKFPVFVPILFLAIIIFPFARHYFKNRRK